MEVMRHWMEANMLKLNDEKIEVMLFTPKHRVLRHVNVKVIVFIIQSLYRVFRNQGALFHQHACLIMNFWYTRFVL